MTKKVKKDAAIFIDRRSINLELKKRGLSMDFEALINAINSSHNIVRAAVYDQFSSHEKSNERIGKFIAFLKRALDISIVEGGLATLITDLMRYAPIYEVAILVSAHPLAPRIAESVYKGLGKEVVGISLQAKTGTELKLACHEFYDLEELGATNTRTPQNEESASNKVVKIKKQGEVEKEKDKKKKSEVAT